MNAAALNFSKLHIWEFAILKFLFSMTKKKFQSWSLRDDLQEKIFNGSFGPSTVNMWINDNHLCIAGNA
jgi:hypothetical protein